MKIKDYHLASNIEDIYVSLYGNFYFFNNFIVSEIHEGVDFTWEKAQDIINAVINHYGKRPVTLINNCINKYSVRPHDWTKFVKANYKLKAYIVVSYNKRSWFNALVENTFLNSRLERFSELTDAIEWVNYDNTKQGHLKLVP